MKLLKVMKRTNDKVLVDAPYTTTGFNHMMNTASVFIGYPMGDAYKLVFSDAKEMRSLAQLMAHLADVMESREE
jgi:hypothetical protein